MKNALADRIDNIIFFIILFTTALVPLLFSTQFSEYYEIPKISVIIFASLATLILWSVSCILRGKIIFTHTPLSLPLGIMLVVVVISTILSPIKWVSVFGNFPRMHDSMAAWIAYIVIFLISASFIRSVKQIKFLTYTLLFSSSLLCLVTLINFIFPNLGWFKIISRVTLAGSPFSTLSLILMLYPAILLPVLSRSSPLHKVFSHKVLSQVLLALFTTTLLLTANSSLLFILGLIFVISLVVIKQSLIESIKRVALPVLISLFIFGLSWIPKIGAIDNPLYNRRVSFPKEITLDNQTAWKVAISTFRDHPLLGSGPGTYLFDFTQNKPAEFNQTRYWNIRFDNSSNEFLHILTTLGGLGEIALILLVGSIVIFAYQSLFITNKDEKSGLSQFLAISALVGVGLLFIHVSTIVSMLTLLILLAMLMGMNKSGSKVSDLIFGLKANKRITDLNLGDIGNIGEWMASVYFIVLFIFIPVLVLTILTTLKFLPILSADIEHQAGIAAASKNGIEAFKHLSNARTINPHADIYHQDLAQLDLLIANKIIQDHTTEGSPSGTLTTQDKTDVQNLIAQSIEEAKAGVNANPLNSQNWEIMGAIYRQLANVNQSALDWSVQSYLRAVAQDPHNPLLRLATGGIYYSAKNYDLAIRFFNDAVNLKPDYITGYYNLSLAFRDKGDFKSAIQAATQAVALLDPKSKDYEIASQFLADLKEKLASHANEGQVPTPAEETPTLQKATSDAKEENLPVKLDLPRAEKVSTPSAIPTQKKPATP